MSRRLNDLQPAPATQSSEQRTIRTAACALLTSLGVASCGNALYAIQVSSASSKLEEARELGAEEYAPYEYTMAQQHLLKARTEAAEADYSDASDLSDLAEGYADKAIRLAREAHHGAGR